jgi:hypothetical protein
VATPEERAVLWPRVTAAYSGYGGTPARWASLHATARVAKRPTIAAPPAEGDAPKGAEADSMNSQRPPGAFDDSSPPSSVRLDAAISSS